MDVQGKAGGIEDDVQCIMSACSCSRRKAASAWKLAKGDRDAAIRSLKEPELIASAYNSPLQVAIQSSDSAKIPVAPLSDMPQSITPRSVTPITLDINDSPHSPQPPATQPSRLSRQADLQTPNLVDASESNSLTVPSGPDGVNHTIDTPARKVSLPPPPGSFPDLAEVSPSVVTNGAMTGAGPSTLSLSTASLSQDPSDEPCFPPPDEKWDFTLPTINLPPGDPSFSPDEGRQSPFSLRRLVSGLQNGLQNTNLRYYLMFFEERVVRREFGASLCGFPSIFYAVATNDEKILRIWVEYGGDVNAKEPRTGIPLLAFIILRTLSSNEDTTTELMTLLSLGADISVLPRALYFPCIDDPVDKLPLDLRYIDLKESHHAWCKEWVLTKLATSINLTQRYFLERTAQDKGPTGRQEQVTRVHDATALHGVKHFLIGQSSATRTVSDTLIKRMALPTSKPLVMAFTGPSGHGKTELAKQMGNLLSLEIECVDCTEMKHETDLFGPKSPFIGHQKGSPLNNFLFRMNKKRCIVFLDEFEKTTMEVRNALLVPFDEGRYADRRSHQEIDCSQTIWIFATNAVDHIILDFCAVHKSELFELNEPIRQKALILDLTTRIKKKLKEAFGNPLSGRLSVVIPFLQFSPVEAAVVAHKFVLELKRRVLESVRVSDKRLVGNIVLELERDGAICKLIADEGYDPDQGARSLQNATESRIGDALVQAYLDEEGQIDDFSPMMKYRVSLARNGTLLVTKVTDKMDEEDPDDAGDQGFHMLQLLSMIDGS